MAAASTPPAMANATRRPSTLVRVKIVLYALHANLAYAAMASNQSLSPGGIVARTPRGSRIPAKQLKTRQYCLKFTLWALKGPSCDRENMITSRE